MKKMIFIMISLYLAVSLHGQDVITMTSGQSFKVKIVADTKDSLKYYLTDDPNKSINVTDKRIIVSYKRESNTPLVEATDTLGDVYCQIVGTGRMMSNKVTIEIDFGQFRSWWVDDRLKDPKTGDRIVFNGMIDALNFMSKDGWLFVQAYAFSQGNNPPVYHYLMKKSKRIIHNEELHNK